MGLGLFHHSGPKPIGGSNTTNNTTNYIYAKEPVAPDPNPFKYRIIKEEIVNKKSILLVKYHGCTTFGGKKLLLLRSVWRHKAPLDPHLLGDAYPVIARFEPNELGWKLARLCAKNI